MVSQHQFFGVRLQVNLAAEIMNREAAKEVPDERHGHDQRHQAALRELAGRYGDRRPDFADLCLIRMSELYPRHMVITVDTGDFRIYRRNKRNVIPLLTPPGA